MRADRGDDALREVVGVLRAHARDVDAEAAFPDAGLRALRESGLMGLLVPEEHGGAGAGLEEFTEVAAELAGGCLSTAMIWAMHCQQVDVLARHAPAELRERVLPLVASGKVYIASVTTEAVKGGHLLTAHSPLMRDGADLVIERDAPVVTGGIAADGYLITMRADEAAAPDEVALVYAGRDQLSVAETGGWDALGMRATHSVGLRLTGRVPAAQVVGGPGGFRAVAVESMIPLAHLGWSACWLGAARGVQREVVAAVRDRGWAVGGSDLARARLARVRIDLELVSAYLRQVCAEVVDARVADRSLAAPATQIHLNTLKVAAAELTFSAVDALMRVAGLAKGYLRGSTIPIERVFRDLRSASLNYADDRLLTAIGALVPLDRAVRLAGERSP